MVREDGSAAGTVILAFVLGGITGAAVALLMAPTSGEEARRMIADKAREGRDTLSTALERGREAYDQARGAGPLPAAGSPETL